MGGLNDASQDLRPITDLELIAFLESLDAGGADGVEGSQEVGKLPDNVNALVDQLISGSTPQEELGEFLDYMNPKN
ncbi:hypothetical protein LAT59_00395 [Candidatus Gracilibacteria bacterium]|nr:hypothetical protein [Candidatus Gracilibacteria bacterium]